MPGAGPREPHCASGRNHAPGTRPARARLHHRLPRVRARPGEGGRPPTRSRPQARAVEAAGADVINQVSAGTRRASRPSPRRCRARAWSFAARATYVGREIPSSLPTASTRPMWRSDPGARRRRSRLDGAADAGRPGFRAQSARGARRGHQRLHRLQPGLPRFHLFGPHRDLPGQPEACREIEFDARAPGRRKRIAVVGSGPAGLACRVTAAERGHG